MNINAQNVIKPTPPTLEARANSGIGMSTLPTAYDCCCAMFLTVLRAPAGTMGKVQIPFGGPLNVNVSVVVHVEPIDCDCVVTEPVD